MESEKINILIGYNQERRDSAEKLANEIREWAQPEFWHDIFAPTIKKLALYEEKLPDYDLCVFLITDEDIKGICEESIQNSEGLIFDIFMAYAFTGRKNTCIVLQSHNDATLNLLRAMAFYIHDFISTSTEISSLAKNLKELFYPINTQNESPRDDVRRTMQKIERGYKKPETPAITPETPIEVSEPIPPIDIDAQNTWTEIPISISESESDQIAVKPSLFDLAEVSDSSETDTDGEVTLIKIYPFPELNSDQYEFALVKTTSGEYFITDQGKTWIILDKTFELKEPDVIKNLVAILKQYGAVKKWNNNTFTIKVENWNGNADENENPDLKKVIMALYACVSFMLNMKIFYV